MDDDSSVRQVLVELLNELAATIHEAATVEQALATLDHFTPDLALLDVHLPDRLGHAVLERMRGSASTRLVPVVMVTGSVCRNEKLAAIEAGVTDFVSKPFDSIELKARIAAWLRVKRFTDTLEEAEKVLVALARTLDARSPHTFGHSLRVAHLAGALAKAIGLDEQDVRTIQRGSLFHDIGKVGIADAILNKPTGLDPAEFEEMKRHPLMGRDLLRHMRTLGDVLPIVYHHHEHVDGSGYPDGLAGDEVPLNARIVSIADVWDALTTTRAYRREWSVAAAAEVLRSEARRGWWDSHLVEVFLTRVVEDHGQLPALAADTVARSPE
ncbi:MAG TPA: HD domain-containing phosphohydrolase [Candidatus Limnocylindria bacterium]